MKRTGIACSAPQGNGSLISKPSTTISSRIGQLDQHSISFILLEYYTFFFFFFNLTYSRWTSLPSCLWSQDLPISPRFTLYNFLSRCKFSTLTIRQPMVEFYLRSHAFRYERKNTNPALVKIALMISALLAGVQITY